MCSSCFYSILKCTVRVIASQDRKQTKELIWLSHAVLLTMHDVTPNIWFSPFYIYTNSVPLKTTKKLSF